MAMMDVLYGYVSSALQQQQAHNLNALGQQQSALGQQAMSQYSGYSSLNNDRQDDKVSIADWMGKRQAELKDKPKGKGVFSQIAGDVKGFIIEHKAVIYFVAAAILIDHFMFKGAFRSRLQDVADKLVKRVEAKVAEVTK